MLLRDDLFKDVCATIEQGLIKRQKRNCNLERL